MVMLIETPSEVSSVLNKPIIKCANCGGFGHIYRNCNHPIISYGIICYQLYYDSSTNSIYPKYLMVQRKDSLAYVEFIRGKYEIENKSYIMKLFTNMVTEERERIRNNTFDALWKEMWCKTTDETNKNFTKEYNEANAKFNILKNGYLVKSGDSVLQISIDYVLSNTTATYNETEWGFPKGRRNINEDDISCAFREFREETGINSKAIKLVDIKPLEEIFSGSNKVRYKHVYYVARYSNSEMFSSFNNVKHQCREIKKSAWCTFQEVQERIRDYNVERKELIGRLNRLIIKSFC